MVLFAVSWFSTYISHKMGSNHKYQETRFILNIFFVILLNYIVIFCLFI